MVGVILINYILCVLPAIVVQELHTRGRGFEWVGVTFNMVCSFWMFTIRLNSWIYIHKSKNTKQHIESYDYCIISLHSFFDIIINFLWSGSHTNIHYQLVDCIAEPYNICGVQPNLQVNFHLDLILRRQYCWRLLAYCFVTGKLL